MSAYIGIIIGGLLAAAVLVLLIAACLREGDRFGDALVRVRLFRSEHPEGPRLFAELEVDNRNDSPVMVSARAREASVLSLFFDTARSRRTAAVHRRGRGETELLGAVEGRGMRRLLLPVAAAHPRAVRVTAVVDQVEQRSRVVSTTLRTVRALPAGFAPAVPPLRRENEEAGRGRP